MKIRYLFLLAWLAAGFGSVHAQTVWQQRFRTPAKEARPWTFWYGECGEVTPETLTADFESMRQAGFAGACLVPVPGMGRIMPHCLEEAARLGLELGIQAGDGQFVAGGPWITPREAMQKVVWSDTLVNGGSLRNLALPQPESVGGFYADIAAYAVAVSREAADTASMDFGDVVQLPLYQGRLTARLPEGKWRILRMGHTAAGQILTPSGEVRGFECDRFSETVVRKQFDHWFASLFGKADTVLVHRVLRQVHIGDWHRGVQNWSDGFAVEFQQRRGYDLLPYLPVLAGVPVESAARDSLVLRDVQATAGELSADVFYAVMADCAHRRGCVLSAGEALPAKVDGAALHYRKVDYPMGAFCLPDSLGGKEEEGVRDAVAAARLYGKEIVSAKGFVQSPGAHDEIPALLKPLLDRHLASGVNKLFFDGYSSGLRAGVCPDTVAEGGDAFLRRTPFRWAEAKPLADYVARCQTLLQYGRPATGRTVLLSDTLPVGMVYTQRIGTEMELFFIANQADSLRAFDVSFQETGSVPQLWDAVTGSIVRPSVWSADGGRATVTLSLPSGGSVFVVFPKGESAAGAVSDSLPVEPVSSEELPLKVNEWTVTFPEVRKSVTRSVLFDWSRDEDESISTYSGRAFYKGLFMWKGNPEGRVVLSLGTVGDMAAVRINSIHCGAAWTAPYEVDITDALRNGPNVIEVEVINAWGNASRCAGLPSGWLGPMKVSLRK